MREVPAVMMDFVRHSAQELGVDTRPILEELGLAHVDPARKGERIDWDGYVAFIERCVEETGPGGAERLATGYNDQNRHMQLMRFIPVPPRAFYRVMTVGTRPYLPHLRIEVRDLPDGRFEASYELPGRYRDGTTMFRGMVHQYRHFAVMLGYPPAEVEADYGSHYGRYRVRLPEPRGATRLVDAGARRFADKARGLLGMFHSAIGTGIGWRAAEILQSRYELTEAETRVAIAIAEGRTPAEAARRLNIAEQTVRTHLKQAFAKTHTHRQAQLVRLVLSCAG